MLAFALWIFPGLGKIFRKKSESEVQKQLEILRQEEQHLANLKEILLRKDEALRQAETQTESERQQKAELQKQIEDQRREEERIKAWRVRASWNGDSSYAIIHSQLQKFLEE